MSDNGEPTYNYWTMVLVGRTGNGKSATGNSILGRNAFKFKRSSSRVTTACRLERTVEDHHIISVIDTPGLFDISSGSELMKECLGLAKDGIHAILVVFSVRNRFSQEEEAAVRSLRSFFGSKIMDYMIVVFTGGDELESNGETLDDYLGGDCPQPLKDLLTACHNRCVLFNNVTRSENQRTRQRWELLSVVNTVFTQNNRCPYNTVEILMELQVEAKLKEANARFEKKLAKEKAAREQAEKNAESLSADVIPKLAAQLIEAKKEIESLARQLVELRNKPTGGICTIL